MLDIRLLRNETEKVKAALARRKEEVDIDAVLALDASKRELLFEVEGLKSKQNEVSKQIPALKKEGKDVAPIFEEMKKLSADIKEYDEKVKQILKIQKELLEAFPEAEQLLESYCTAHYESADIFGYQQFQLGMKVGAQLVLEMIKPIKRGGRYEQI